MKARYVVTTFLAVCMLASLFCACTVIKKEPLTPGIENVTIVSNCQSIGRDEEVEPNTKAVLQTALARNEGEAVQFVCNFDTDVKNLAITVSELSDGNGNTLDVTPYREHYIYIGENPSYMRMGWLPDALIPIEYADTNSVDVKAGQNQGFWLTANSTLDQPAGIYTGEVTLTYDGGIQTIPVEFEVWDFTVPVKPSFITSYGISDDPFNLMTKNGAADGWTRYDAYKQYYDFFLDYRITARSIPDDGSDYLSQLRETLKDERVSCVALPFWEGSFPYDAGNVTVPDSFLTFINTLREDGTLSKCFVSLFDEIGDGTQRQRAVIKAVHEAAPDLRLMTTSSPRDSLSGLLNVFDGIWSAPTVAFERYIREWQEKGNEVWWYGCISPQAPYPTYHTQDRLMSSRVVHWMQKDWNITGNTFWAAGFVWLGWDFDNENGGYFSGRDQWTNPYVTPCAGDGVLVYAGTENDGIINRNIPVPTLRLESIRDGSEDNEYLCILTDKIQQKLDAWGITDIDADAIMDTYYTPVYNTMGDYNHDPEIMLEVRRQMAHDIMNADSIVSVLAYMDTENTNKREVRVYAEPSSEVVIDGNAATEVNHGKYSTYSAVFLTAYEDMRKILISVNCNEYERYLKTIEDYEFMELGCLSVKHNVQKLGLPFDYWGISDQYEENMFAPKTVKQIGNLSEQLGSMSSEKDSEKVIINTDRQIAYAMRDCIRTDYNNTIPLVVTNAEIYGDTQKLQHKRLTLYVPHGATVKVEGNDAERTAQSENYDTFTYDIEENQACRYIYEVEVTLGEKTEIFKKVVMQQTVKAALLTDLTDEATIKAISDVSLNKYGTALEIKNGAFCASFPPISRLTVPGETLLTGQNLTGYNAIRFEVKNTGTVTQSGIEIRVSASSANEKCGQSGEIEPGQTVVVFAEFPESYMSSGTLEQINNITFVRSNAGSEKDQYEISNIVALNINTNQN